MAAKFTKGDSTATTRKLGAAAPPRSSVGRGNTMKGMPGHVPTGLSSGSGRMKGGSPIRSGGSIKSGLSPGGREIGSRGGSGAKSMGRGAAGTTGKMESLKGRVKTRSESPRKGSTMYALALLALPAILFAAFSLVAPDHAHAAALLGALPAPAKLPLLAMTIQAWIPGDPEQKKTAQVGFFQSEVVSTTVSLAGATLIPTDLLLIPTMGGAGAVKMLGGQDTSNGPCIVGDTVTIMNHSGQNVTVYPNNALGKVKNGAAGAGTVLTTGQTGYLVYIGSDNWAMQAS